MINLAVNISLFTSVKSTNASIKEVPLINVLAFISNGKWRGLVEAVRNERDEARQKALKEQLPCFTPSGTFNGRKADSIKQHSGFVCIDIDEKDNKQVKDFARLKEILTALPYVAYCATSCRGNGYFCLIPIADTTKHREYCLTLQSAFEACGIIVDKSCIDVCRKRYVSYDPAPYINTNAKLFSSLIKDDRQRLCRGSNEITEETRLKVADLVEAITQEHIDVCGDYNQWFGILCAIAHAFGEDGREWAHLISEQGATYKSAEEVDKRYNEAYKSKAAYNIGTFIYHAENAIKQHRFEHDFNGII